MTREELLNIIETDHVQCGEAAALARMALAFYEWHDKTAWVQTDKRFDVLTPWGKHRADVLKEYIEHLENRIAMDSKPAVVIAGLTEDELDEIQERIKYENVRPDGIIVTQPAPVVPGGYALVPLKPTKDMLTAAEYDRGADWQYAIDIWDSMCRAAMLATVPESEDRYLVPENVSRKDAYLAGEWNNECNPRETDHD
ncbi:hypothetical protein vBKpnSCarvaje_0089 [Klebsiella phage vB_KpnS-Carvaje]|uniref:Uncharacterized protein n=1 Tax=Klebsiella phage vB_KpnS-Carvaje TaxID=2900314 RepID=A0AAE9CJZ7_9CAUD|nr:hypothetical protein PQD67_gp052 [Klebsiella phage vB_KpnS-Carvaje]UJQ44053.1 hypothetical protein vBKpnSCarvaje_0089 [Klebsiella phage vB_KpnS-Carvaje]